VGELIAREVAQALGVSFGIVDLSLAPTPTVGDSVGEILQCLGLESIGVPGSTAALALLNDAVKKGGAFASSSVSGSGFLTSAVQPLTAGPDKVTGASVAKPKATKKDGSYTST
jgi:hypothetical protein